MIQLNKQKKIINKNKFFICYFVDVELKKIVELYVKVKSPSCSDQSDLKAPDIVITICQLVSMYIPGGLECRSMSYSVACSDIKGLLKSCGVFWA